MRFAGRTIVITGASGNLGRVVAREFAAAGANLILAGADPERLKAAFASQAGKYRLVPADLLDRAQAQRMAEAAREAFGRIDVLCNIAGGFKMGEAVHETSDETWRLMFDLNVRTLLNAVRAVVPLMIEAGGGKIVNVGAFAAREGAARMGAYIAAKSAVNRLTESMSAELRASGINVNCVLPTTLDTPDNRRAMPDADPAKWVAPEDVAKTMMFLASDDGRALHGAAVPVKARK
jgi:NAD(P)-dependent dehydrogenase (short-subunit alcohol dehydrogenase family)